jgi:GxxExxY protein
MEQGDHELKRVDDPLTGEIIGACIEVHRCLGPGLLETAYEQCLCRELSIRGLSFRRQVPLPINYKGVLLDCGYRMDLVVNEQIIVEIKAVDCIPPVHLAQMLTYLKLSGADVGLLINFNVPSLRSGIRRLTRTRSPR